MDEDAKSVHDDGEGPGDVQMTLIGGARDRDDDEAQLVGRSSTPRTSDPPRNTVLTWCLWALGIAVLVAFVVLIVGVMRKPQSVTLPSMSYAETSAANFRKYPTAAGARESLEVLTKSAHLAGSADGKATAEYVRDRFVELGLTNTVMEEYRVLLNDPVPDGAVLQIISPPSAVFTAALKEAALAEDAMSQRVHPGPFNGYAPSGDVNGSYVYANYARVEDFKALQDIGISVAGRIVLARYGKIFRGNKVENAEKLGATGVIIFSDPADDGFVKGPVYPEGPWRPATSVQRGSVFVGNGDPMTPGYPSTATGLKLTLDEARNAEQVGGAGWALPTIPAIPLSYGDAEPLLQALANEGPAGSTMPGNWQGGLPFDYFVGPSTAVVRFKTRNNFRIKSIWNVVATITGDIEPDRWVIGGNHRDAWVAGAVDPSSGMASVIEVARGLGKMLQTGWKPSRSIMLCSWDAEEYGLVGSTEFVEAHMNSLQDKAVAYVNMDESVDMQAPMYVETTPSLNKLTLQAAKAVTQPKCVDPDSTGLCAKHFDNNYADGDTLYSFWAKTRPEKDSSPPVPEVQLLGSGSDQTAFIAHAGVSAMYMGFSGGYPVYHSVYDSFDWMRRFGDPSFEFHKAAAQYMGTLLILLAEDPVLPFDFTDYANAMFKAEADLSTHLAALGGSAAAPAGGIRFNGYEEFGMATPGPAPATQHTLDLVLLRNATIRFANVAKQVQEEATELARSAASGEETDPRFLLKVRSLNDRFMHAERAFIAPEGLPRRNWFKHVVFAPSLHDSYGATAFPAVSDALAIGNWREAQRQLDAVVHLLDRATESLAANTL